MSINNRKYDHSYIEYGLHPSSSMEKKGIDVLFVVKL